MDYVTKKILADISGELEIIVENDSVRVNTQPNLIARLNFFESIENTNKRLTKLDYKINSEFENVIFDAFDDIMDDEDFAKYHNSLKENEKKLLRWLASIIFIFQLNKYPIHEKLNEDLKKCKAFLKTDVCRRNRDLRREVCFEIISIKDALAWSNINVTVNRIYDAFQLLNPKGTPQENKVKTSEALHYLKIKANTPFNTLEEQIQIEKKRDLEEDDYFSYGPKAAIAEKIHGYLSKDWIDKKYKEIEKIITAI